MLARFAKPFPSPLPGRYCRTYAARDSTPGHSIRVPLCVFFDLRWYLDCLAQGMAGLEHLRDFIKLPPGEEYFQERSAAGWRLAAIEWERGADSSRAPVEEVPFGLRVSSDCHRLEEDPGEVQVLMLMMETIVQDGPLSQAAQAINARGYRTRNGLPWTRQALFYLLPRLIEMGPRLCTSEEWVERRKHIFNAA